MHPLGIVRCLLDVFNTRSCIADGMVVAINTLHLLQTLLSCLLLTGFNISVPAIVEIVRGGIDFALESAPSHLRFLAWGLGHFTTKLPPEEAAKLVSELEAAVVKLPAHDKDDEEWNSLYHYLQGLRVRGVGLKVSRESLCTQAACLACRCIEVSCTVQLDGNSLCLEAGYLLAE